MYLIFDMIYTIVTYYDYLAISIRELNLICPKNNVIINMLNVTIYRHVLI